MKIEKEIVTYCPTCNRHTKHIVKLYTKGAEKWMNVGRRRHERAIRGYVGSVEPKIHPKKLGKKQKAILQCEVCKRSAERVLGGRTKKKLEIKR